MSGVISVLVYALEAIFVLGVVGSLAVLVLTTIEDTETLFERSNGKSDADRPAAKTTLSPASQV